MSDVRSTLLPMRTRLCRKAAMRVSAVAPGASPPTDLTGAKKLAATRPHAGGASDEVNQLRAEKLKAYTEHWRSDVDMSNRFNVMNSLLLVALVAPLAGLAFAAATYGHLWGTTAGTGTGF